MSNSITIRPGLLVALNTTVRGGVSYERVDIVTGEKLESGAKVSKWNTTKTVDDPEELERAEKVRGKARGLISRVCVKSAFGLLCPEDKEGELNAALAEARVLTEQHNNDPRNKNTYITVFVMKGRVSSDDAEAMRSITSEIAGLVTEMNDGIKDFDVKKIREAADQARRVSAMLGDEAAAKANAAIEQARKAARMIVKRIETDGEDKSIVLMDIQRGQIESARIAFLDMSGESNEVTPTVAAVETQRFADLDAEVPSGLCAADIDAAMKASAPARNIEMEV